MGDTLTIASSEGRSRYRTKAQAKRRRDAIVRAYANGARAQSIGKRFGITANAVYQVICRMRRRKKEKGNA